jgi:hypothetical protein
LKNKKLENFKKATRLEALWAFACEKCCAMNFLPHKMKVGIELQRYRLFVPRVVVSNCTGILFIADARRL